VSTGGRGGAGPARPGEPTPTHRRASRRVRLAASLLLLGAVAPRLTAQAADAGAILDRAVRKFGHVTTLRADFSQFVHDPMLGATDTSWGEFLQQRPGKFALRWQHPKGDLIVADGEVMWVYLPSSVPNQVVKTTLTGKPGESADLVAEFLDHPSQRFVVSYARADSVRGRAADVLSLVPRQQGTVPYRRVLIWVDREDTLVHRVEISESSGAVRRLTFDRMRVNVPIPASTFRFRPPAGARIVDASQ
jgi:outer membrane lipoprotein carrier protein